MLIAVCIVAALQTVFTYAPFMNLLFKTRPLDAWTSLQIIAVGVLVLLILEIEKLGQRASYGSTARAAQI